MDLTIWTQYLGEYAGLIMGAAVAFTVLFYCYFENRKFKAAIMADIKTENKIKGKVEAVLIMPYIPGGWGSFDREEQTEIVFKNGERVRVAGLHPEIKKGETWRIKYAGTGKYFIPVLMEKTRR